MSIKKMKSLLVLIISYIASLSFLFAAEEPLLFIAAENTTPYSWKEGITNKGIDYDICLEVVKRLGLNAKIEFFPFPRELAYLQNGTADATFQIYHSKDRELFLLFSTVPVHLSSTTIYTFSS
jgi:ABC-type amino acid transport substrate-binding protein